MNSKIFILLFIVFTILSCTPKSPVQQNESLKESLSFKVGAAISYRWFTNSEDYRELLKNHFNSVTFTNEMKMHKLQQNEGVWDFSLADSMVEFALSNKMQVHGHTLVWHSGTPQWVEKYDGDSAMLEQILKEHIQKTANHFKGKVRSWDVINEAISDKANEFLRETIWSRNLGPEYISRVFNYAHEADSSALLFYNDYDIEFDSLKFDKVLTLVKHLQSQGIPIHGIGFQLHTQIGWPPIHVIDSTISKAVKTGLLIHFSEVDVSVNGRLTDAGYLKTFEADMAQAQMVRYVQLAEIFNHIPEKQQYAFTTWGVHDGSTWLRSFFVKNKHEWPLLFNDDFEPKPAVKGLIEQFGIVNNKNN